MIDDATVAHLHSGCALIIGSVSADGAPHANRGHGLRVLAVTPPQVRVLLAGGDERLLGNLRATSVIAITSADVPTLRSLQLKGRVREIVAATPDDHAAAASYRDQFLHDIEVTDHHLRAVLEPWAAVDDLVACVVDVTEMFDQTPGPSAGSSWG